MRAVRRVTGLVVGWLLVLVGIAALVLPGPGLLLLFAGLTVLSQEYAWAKARVEPVKSRAFQTARESVRTRSRILFSVSSALAIVGVGILWFVDPRIPEIGPLGPRLPFGGWGTGVSLIVSGLVALALVLESVRRFRMPEPAAPPETPTRSENS